MALAAAVHFAIALALAVVIAVWFKWNVFNLLALVNLIPFMMMCLLLGWSLAALVGFASVYFPDVRQMCEVGLQFLFYLTPILIPMAALRGGPMEKLFALNPLAYFLEILREPVVNGAWPSAFAYVVALVTTALTLSAAIAVLIRCERRIIFHL
jgi:ABC-type polysaccharide/polyol phosphate export permease